MKVVIAIPARGQVETGFALDLGSLAAHKIEGVSVGINTSNGTILCEQRIDLARHALGVGADYILWLDTDMRFPRNALQRLLDHKVPIVAANYVTRRIPVTPIAQNFIAESGEWETVKTTPESIGLEEVSVVGMGLMLTETAIFKNLSQPWFTFPWDTERLTHCGEDYHFCMGAAAAGFPTKIDHDLSRDVRHIGSFEFAHDHVDATS